jgi:hypothetical protein
MGYCIMILHGIHHNDTAWEGYNLRLSDTAHGVIAKEDFIK